MQEQPATGGTAGGPVSPGRDGFWAFYLAEHRRPGTRALHYAGTATGLVCLALAVATGRWWLVAVGLAAGYGFAWSGHYFVERNRPATFRYPLRSFLGDFRMFGTWLAGRMGRELDRHGLR